MGEALLVVQFLNAAIAAGLNLSQMLEKVSSLIRERRFQGGTLTAEDLAGLLAEGDELERAARAQFQASLADPNTPQA